MRAKGRFGVKCDCRKQGMKGWFRFSSYFEVQNSCALSDITKNEYEELVKYAVRLLYRYKYLQIEAYDLVHDGILAQPNDIKKGIRRALDFQKYYVHGRSGFNLKYVERLPCSKCKDDHPIAAFYIWFNSKTNCYIASFVCRTCRNEKAIKYYHARRTIDPDFKKKTNEKIAKWRKDMKGTEYYKKQEKERQKKRYHKTKDDPVEKAKRKKHWDKWNKKYRTKMKDDPAYKRKNADRAKRWTAVRKDDPAYKEMKKQQSKKYYHDRKNDPEFMAKKRRQLEESRVRCANKKQPL